MRYVFTEKAESDGVGKAGAPAVPKDAKQLAFWLLHAYVTPSGTEPAEPAVKSSPKVESAKPVDATVVRPSRDAVIRKGGQ